MDRGWIPLPLIYCSLVVNRDCSIFCSSSIICLSWRTGFPTKPCEYASLAAQSVLGQVLEGVAPLSNDARVQALSITTTAFMEAWMEHILKQRIKFRSGDLWSLVLATQMITSRRGGILFRWSGQNADKCVGCNVLLFFSFLSPQCTGGSPAEARLWFSQRVDPVRQIRSVSGTTPASAQPQVTQCTRVNLKKSTQRHVD